MVLIGEWAKGIGEGQKAYATSFGNFKFVHYSGLFMIHEHFKIMNRNAEHTIVKKSLQQFAQE